jgi:hypothetical protein
VKASDIMDISLPEAGELVNDELLDSIGDLLNDAKVSVATVHFTLGYMIASSIGDTDDPKDVAVGCISIQQYIYNVSMNVFRRKRKSEAN